MKNMLERFLRLLSGDPTAGVIWTADISYWLEAQKASGKADAAWSTERGYLELHRSLGIMPYYYYEKFWAATPEYDTSIKFSQIMRNDQHLKRIHTPEGTVSESSVWLASSCSTGVKKHYIETETDLDILLHILEHRRLKPSNLADYNQRLSLWRAYDGLPCIGLPRSPLAAFVYEWAGIESATYLLIDCEAKVRRALDLMAEQEAPILDEICRLRPPVVHFPDNLSSDNLTGFYDAYMADAHQQRLERLHAAGIKAAVHLDGAVRGLLPKLIAVGFDAIEALTPHPGGDLDVEEIARIAENSDVILWGGIPGIMFAPPYTWADMKAHVEKVLSCWGKQRFVLGVADQVPPDGDIRFCLRISEMV
ncbi:hypothetical protein JXJ21_11660 [candidate division KSB1 bacterium]|nr:hypothetical protein [candidate division KSB1 bacterium]